MAYASSDLFLTNSFPMSDPSGTGGFSQWHYANGALDTQATIGGSSYISDGCKRGLKVGDQVIVWNSSALTLQSYAVKTARSSLLPNGLASVDLTSGMSLSS